MNIPPMTFELLLTGKLQVASGSLLTYGKNLKDKIKELGLEKKFDKLFETGENSLNENLENVEELVDDITDAFNDLFLDSLND